MLYVFQFSIGFVSYGRDLNMWTASVIFVLLFLRLFRPFSGVIYSADRSDLWRWL